MTDDDPILRGHQAVGDDRRWALILARLDDLDTRVAAQERRWVYRRRQKMVRHWRDQAVVNLHRTGKLTLTEMGHVFGLTAERIRQILKQPEDDDAVSRHDRRGSGEGEGAAG